MVTPVYVNTRSPVVVQASRMSRIEDRLAELDRQVSTGEKILQPSDDPAGANRIAMLVRMQGRLDSEQQVIDRANTRLSLAETGIETSHGLLLRARDLALTAANGSSNAEVRQVIAHEISILKQQLVDTANMRDDGGNFIFGGASNGDKPYVADATGTVEWRGFGATAGAEGAGIANATPPAGPRIFGDDLTGAFAQLDQMIAALNEPDDDLRNAGLAQSIESLDSSIGRLTMGQAMVGASMARLETELDRITAARLDTQEELASVAGVDLTAAFAEMQALHLSLSAAQLSFSRLFDGTLFDRLG